MGRVIKSAEFPFLDESELLWVDLSCVYIPKALQLPHAQRCWDGREQVLNNVGRGAGYRLRLRREGMRWVPELGEGGRVGCDAHVSVHG